MSIKNFYAKRQFVRCMKGLSKTEKYFTVCRAIFRFARIVWRRIVDIVIEIFALIRIY